MINIPNIIVGMASMLLIEIALFYDDVISYKPNHKKVFVGDEIGVANTEKNKIEHTNYFKSSLRYRLIFNKNQFSGSNRRMSGFIEDVYWKK